MARIGRYAGALVVESAGAQILVGNPKEPCAVTELLAPPYVLPLVEPVALSGCVLVVDDTGAPELATAVAEKLLVQRNGSASERLWRLVTHQRSSGEVSAQWLVEIPPSVWAVVRDAVLKCS